jgi:hypothetical protein
MLGVGPVAGYPHGDQVSGRRAAARASGAGLRGTAAGSAATRVRRPAQTACRSINRGTSRPGWRTNFLRRCHSVGVRWTGPDAVVAVLAARSRVKAVAAMMAGDAAGAPRLRPARTRASSSATRATARVTRPGPAARQRGAQRQAGRHPRPRGQAPSNTTEAPAPPARPRQQHAGSRNGREQRSRPDDPLVHRITSVVRDASEDVHRLLLPGRQVRKCAMRNTHARAAVLCAA